MRAILVVAVAALLVCMFAAGTSAAPAPMMPTSNGMCEFCVSAMDQMLQQLINIIANVGVLGSCGDLCSKLPNQLEQAACNLICDAVGIELLVKLLQKADPDPIYFCQMLHLCVEATGAAQINAAQCIPSTIKQGDTVMLEMQYTVLNATGVGLIAVNVVTPDGSSGGIGQSNLWMPQQPGPPTLVQFQLETTPSENEAFGPGVYQVQWLLCNGDCGNVHPYSGVYAQASTQFTISQ